jgi:Doubled CXXCH motif (Paired_CXXCH_1)
MENASVSTTKSREAPSQGERTVDAMQSRFERWRALIVAVALLCGAPAAWAQVPEEAAPGAGIRYSAHDFTWAGNGAYQPDERASVCIFCHIQHRPGTSPPVAPPQPTRLLWNHKMSTNTFTWSDVTTTYNGTLLPTDLGTWAGNSRMCLSCHDGSVSVGDLYRGVQGQNLTSGWTGNRVNAAGFLTTSFMIIGATGDLKGNHPVGIPYPYNGVPSTYNGITSAITPAYAATDYVAQPVNVHLYSDVGNSSVQGATEGITGIECGSCHDVHNKNVVENPFLRDYYATAGSKSQICLDCHNK